QGQGPPAQPGRQGCQAVEDHRRAGGAVPGEPGGPRRGPVPEVTPDRYRVPRMRHSRLLLRLASALVPAALAGTLAAQQPTVDPAVRAAEAQRVAAVNKVRPAVVAMCVYGGQAIGSGVLIDPAGYALTNYHVTESI